MQQLLKKVFLVTPLLFLCAGIFAQQDLKITLNNSFFKANDSIHITASQAPGKKNAATLFLMAENKDGMAWEMRWPMLNGKCNATLVIPDSLPAGQYRFHFSLLQNLFTVFGKVKTPEKVTMLNSTLLTSAGDLYESEVAVDKEGRFAYKNVLFQNEATMLFTLQEHGSNDNLNIEISTILDSAIAAGNDKIFDLYIGETEPEEGLQKFVSITDTMHIAAKELTAVTVYSKPAKRGEIFDKKYSGGLFRSTGERMISLLDDPTLNNALTPLQLVRMQIPGIQIGNGVFPSASWRGDRVYFFIDEMRADINDVNSTPLENIAIIKAYPPPFFGNIGGSGGAVAIYTKRGGFTDDNYKNAFKVKGYTALTSAFPVNPDRL